MENTAFLSNFKISELPDYIRQEIEKRLNKNPFSKFPKCPRCENPLTTVVYDNEGIKKHCESCGLDILVAKFQKEKPEPRPLLPKCAECKSEPGTVTVFSGRINGGIVCGGCANLQKYRGN